VVGDDLTIEGTEMQMSLVQQIYKEMFSRIMGQEEFNPDMIEDLKQLAAKGDLKKPQKVVNVIKSTLKDDYETA
jgi:hypothetical protein